jgi:GT2 family glycosyltransferase
VHRFAPAGTQIIVVDDGSTDGTPGWLADNFPHVEIVRLEGNHGFCQAVNEGLRHVRGDVVELLNNDTEVCAGWAEPCLRHFHDPTIGSVAPLVLRMESPNIIDSAGQQYHVCGWATDRGYGQPVTDAFLHNREVFGPCASSGFYRRSALERVGGLLPEFEAYLEDVDLSFRLRWAAYRCVYEPASRVLHRRSASYGKSEHVLRMLSRNEELVWWNNLPLGEMLLGMPAHAAFLLVRLLRSAAAGRLKPFLAGKLEAFRRGGLMQRRRREVRRIAAAGRQLHLERNLRVLLDGCTWLTKGQFR